MKLTARQKKIWTAALGGVTSGALIYLSTVVFIGLPIKVLLLGLLQAVVQRTAGAVFAAIQTEPPPIPVGTE